MHEVLVSDRLVTAPGSEPLQVDALLREHLRQYLPDDAPMVEDLLRAARTHLERVYGLALLTQTRRCQVVGWPASRCWVPLPTWPVQDVTAVHTVTEDGTETLVSASTYYLDAEHQPARLVWTDEPSTRHVRITYVAGFGSVPGDVPDDLLHALRLLVAHWYDTPSSVDSVASRQADFGVDALVSAYATPVCG